MLRLLTLAAFVLAAALQPAAAQDAIDRIADGLTLSDDQVEIVEDVYRDGDAGSVWTLLGELEPTLTDAQRATLLTPPERRQGGARAGRGGRGGQGGRSGQRGRRPGRTEAEQAAASAARDAALGLTTEQSVAVDAAFAARRQAGPGGELVLPSSLTPRQTEMLTMQRGLMRMLFRRGGRRG